MRYRQEKKEMQDKIFIDSNIFIYAFLEGTIDDEKRAKSIALIESLAEKSVIISTQVLGEIFNTLSRKYKINKEVIVKKLNILTETVTIKGLSLDTVKKTWDLVLKNNFLIMIALSLLLLLKTNALLFIQKICRMDRFLKV